jgi:hypothetical protein
MRVNWTVLVLAVAAGMTSTPAFTDSHGRPVTAPPHPAPAASTKSASHLSPTTSSPTTSTSTTAPVQLNPIAAKIASKPQLNTRITAMLPKGMTLNQASSGFRNQGQFLAALHVSQNLGCDCFKQIKADMVGKHMSLGQAIQDVKKTSNTSVEVHKAETEADEDVRVTGTGTSASSGPAGTRKPVSDSDR